MPNINMINYMTFIVMHESGLNLDINWPRDIVWRVAYIVNQQH